MENISKEHQKFKDPGFGTLYVVGTPIGNLEDITLRAIKTLKYVDLIAAENTNHSKRLCNHYGIKTKLISYNQHNSRTRAPELVNKLINGFNIALITSAGTPVLSDPGTVLINTALNKKIKVSPVPGPSAAIASISVCGLKVDRFLFQGFLSNKPGKRKKELMDLTDENKTMIFYEAPHRIRSTLMDINDIMGERHIVILRELTKIHEEIMMGNASSLLQELDEDKIKGEFTIIVSGSEETKKDQLLDDITKEKIKKLINEGGMGVKKIAIQLSQNSNINYRKIYKEALRVKNETSV